MKGDQTGLCPLRLYDGINANVFCGHCGDAYLAKLVDFTALGIARAASATSDR